MTNIQDVVTVKQLKTVDVECNVCGKLAGTPDPDGWHHMNHHHDGWGSESSETYENFDVCSIECFAMQIERSIDEVGGEYGSEISGMNVEFAKKLLDVLKRNVIA